MGSIRRTRLFAALLIFFLASVLPVPAARAQFGETGLPELSQTLLDAPDSATRTHLEQLKQYVANRQWQEAIDVLAQVNDESGDKLLLQDSGLAISVREHCQRQLVELPPEALELYRDRVDAEARHRFEAGLSGRDRYALSRVVDDYFASRYGDDALSALAEIALEAGQFARARTRWQQLMPAGGPFSGSADLLRYPDPQQPPATVAARLVLVSILEGSTERAAEELAAFRAEFPDATGRLAGRSGPLADNLEKLLATSGAWPNRHRETDWPTFAGSANRNTSAPRPIDVGAAVWEIPLTAPPASDARMARRAGLPLLRVAEKHEQPLSYHPVVVGDLVLLSTLYEVNAYDLATGTQRWSAQSPSIQPRRDPRFNSGRNLLGTPRFTLTAHGTRVYANLGPAGSASVGTQRSQLVCLDLEAEGRLIWKGEAGDDEDNLVLDGVPLSDGRYVFIAARKYDISSVSAYVLCFDAASGRRLWKRYVCAANSPGGGSYNEISHNLLTLNYGTIYFNTNLGGIGALCAEDGRLQWVATYPRAQRRTVGEDYHHLYRDLVPCVYAGGKIYVAPSDAGQIFAFHAGSGAALWATAPGAANSIVHLLGVGEGNLLASGKSLWWIDAENGKVRRRYAEQGTMQAWGRGVLAGDKVYWPSRGKIYVASQATPPAERPIQRVIDLRNRKNGATGGNLVPAGDLLLVAGFSSLDAYSQFSQVPEVEDTELTQRPPDAGTAAD